MIYDISNVIYGRWYNMISYDMIWYEYDMIWYDMIWYDQQQWSKSEGNRRGPQIVGVYGGFCSKYPAFVSSCHWVGQYIPICSNRLSAKEMSTLDSQTLCCLFEGYHMSHMSIRLSQEMKGKPHNFHKPWFYRFTQTILRHRFIMFYPMTTWPNHPRIRRSMMCTWNQ